MEEWQKGPNSKLSSEERANLHKIWLENIHKLLKEELNKKEIKEQPIQGFGRLDD